MSFDFHALGVKGIADLKARVQRMEKPTNSKAKKVNPESLYDAAVKEIGKYCSKSATEIGKALTTISLAWEDKSITIGVDGPMYRHNGVCYDLGISDLSAVKRVKSAINTFKPAAPWIRAQVAEAEAGKSKGK